MRGDDVPKPGEVFYFAFEPIETSRACVRFVPIHHTGPLFCTHRCGAAIRQQVNEHIIGMDKEHVVRSRLKDAFSIRHCGEADWLH